ncbi:MULTISPECIES: SDR family oxidoreductase [unclassified Burkholderia]|uniref:SDR family oxidoreductase n=1 Tax=unclassified Burkholderia TaxID=2613784 RepID=UPI002AAF173C|nr:MULTISPECIES: SDR family oxidoreductase [unclassified Burkholderia]
MGTIAVTGTASGIGAATQARLASEGHRVISVDRHEADVVCDLGSEPGRQFAIERINALSDGRLDGLVTCAGVGGFPHRRGAEVAAINYFGTAVLLSGLRPALAASENASVVVISSNSSTAQPGWPEALAAACLSGDETLACTMADTFGPVLTYPATKAAIARLVRRLAPGKDWIGSGIRLNAIAPGLIETALAAEGRTDPDIARQLDAFPIPVGRPGTPEEVASLIAFLLGTESRFMCGSVIWLDGGTDALLRPDDWPVPMQLA